MDQLSRKQVANLKKSIADLEAKIDAVKNEVRSFDKAFSTSASRMSLASQSLKSKLDKVKEYQATTDKINLRESVTKAMDSHAGLTVELQASEKVSLLLEDAATSLKQELAALRQDNDRLESLEVHEIAERIQFEFEKQREIKDFLEVQISKTLKQREVSLKEQFDHIAISNLPTFRKQADESDSNDQMVYKRSETLKNKHRLCCQF